MTQHPSCPYCQNPGLFGLKPAKVVLGYVSPKRKNYTLYERPANVRLHRSALPVDSGRDCVVICHNQGGL
jgi:hypothetical protein